MSSLRGSEWSKWDLHVHSPKTFLANEYGGCSVDEFVQKVVDAGVKAIGLTNYFRYDSSTFEEIKTKLEVKGITVFYNLEFRTQPKNKENDEMHIHVIFSNELSMTKINNVLGRLKTVDNKYCKDLTVEDIKTTSISFDSLVRQLREDEEVEHLTDYLLIACPRGHGSFRPSKDDDGRGNALAIKIDSETDILFGSKDDVDFFLNKERYDKAVEKPVLRCSDAHKLGDIGSKFTWVKAEPTFEGLKQTLWDPSERTRIQERNPADSKSKRVIIDKVRYNISSGEGKTVFFNSDLNSIIGSRGSGKSTLLRNIAIKIDSEQYRSKDSKEPYQLNDFIVDWLDEKQDSGTQDSPKSIFYIPQSYLSSLAYDDGEKASERDAFLTRLLKKNDRFANAVQSYESFVSTNKIKIEKLIQDLLTAFNNAKDISLELRKQGAKAEIEKEIKQKKADIVKYKDDSGKSVTENEVNKYSQLKRSSEELTKKINILNQDKIILNNLLKSDANILVANQEFSRLSQERKDRIEKELAKKGQEYFKELVQGTIEKIKQGIDDFNKTIKKNSSEIQTLGEKIKKSKALDDLAKEIGNLEKNLDRIEFLNKNLSQNQTTYQGALKELVKAYSEFDEQQKIIYDTVEFSDDFSFLEVKVVAKYNIHQLRTFVERNINTRDTDAGLKSDQQISELFSSSPIKPSEDLIEKIIKGLVTEKIKIKVEAGDLAAVISELLKNRYEIDYLNSVRTKKDEVYFKDMTGGQKAIALLELVFRFDDEQYPILIDQPEDDLDVSGVATDLVNFIRSEKRNRQIIIVSHNASLVVCSDSENILVSSHSKESANVYNFSYSTGAIENLEIRENIIKVLEGGRDALRQRARKLSF